MYFFFAITSSVEAKQLVDMDFYFKENYSKTSEQWFYGKFIRAAVYQKSGC
jgi:hypothetical protein